MKKLTLIFTLLVSTVMFSSPSYAKWTKVGEGVSGTTYYVDFESMKKNGGYVTYWVLRNYLKPDKFGMLSGKTYYQGDCKLFKYKSLSGSFHKEPMGGGSTVNYSPKNPNWKHPPSNSVIEEILKSYCSSEVQIMKKLSLTLLTCLIFISPNVVVSETMDNLLEREGIWFKKFTQISFTGEVTVQFKGIIKKGKMVGDWVSYREGGQLMAKGN